VCISIKVVLTEINTTEKCNITRRHNKFFVFGRRTTLTSLTGHSVYVHRGPNDWVESVPASYTDVPGAFLDEEKLI
jgi:hypothetical protein